LLIVGGLLGRSFLELTSVDPGYAPARVLTAQVALPPSMPPPLQKHITRRLLDRLASAPAVEAVGMTSALPLEKVHVMFEVRSGDDPRSRIRTAYRVVSPGYLETVGMRMLAGRTFTWSDDASSPLAAVVNESFARRYLDSGRAIGTELASGVAGRPWVVIGVAQDVRYSGLDRPTSPTLYTSFLQRTQIAFFGRLDLVVRTTGDPRAFVPVFRDLAHDVDDRLATYGLSTMEEQLSASVARPRLYSGTVTTFAVMSVIVSAIGLYGALGYAVTLRRREIAIRTAIGATAGQVVRLVMRDVMVIAVVAVLAGGGAGLLAAHYLEGLLFGVERLDPVTLTAVPILILSLAAVASLLPVRKALSVPPAIVLRSE
jgi:predicted permease